MKQQQIEALLFDTHLNAIHHAKSICFQVFEGACPCWTSPEYVRQNAYCGKCDQATERELQIELGGRWVSWVKL